MIQKKIIIIIIITWTTHKLVQVQVHVVIDTTATWTENAPYKVWSGSKSASSVCVVFLFNFIMQNEKQELYL